MGCAASGTRQPVCEESFHGKYVLGAKLGQGNFGQVRVAKQRSSKTVRAVKILDLQAEDLKGGGIADKRRLRDAVAEAEVMHLLGRHAHCVQLYETFIDQSVFYLVMEKCEDVWSGLRKMRCASEGHIAHLFRDMLQGIAHVHEMNLVHRDIKPDNFLFGGPHGNMAKLTDFGMTCQMSKKGYLTSHCGTAPYMSPQVAAHEHYDFRTDVWSMGVTAYVILYGIFPYIPKTKTAEAMKKQILCGTPAPEFVPASPSSAAPSERAQSFVRALMVREQAQRCTSEEALRLPFVRPDMPKPSDQAHDLTPSLRRAELEIFEERSNAAKAADGLETFLTAFPAQSITDSTCSPTQCSENGEDIYSSEDSEYHRLMSWMAYADLR